MHIKFHCFHTTSFFFAFDTTVLHQFIYFHTFCYFIYGNIITKNMHKVLISQPPFNFNRWFFFNIMCSEVSKGSCSTCVIWARVYMGFFFWFWETFFRIFFPGYVLSCVIVSFWFGDAYAKNLVSKYKLFLRILFTYSSNFLFTNKIRRKEG